MNCKKIIAIACFAIISVCIAKAQTADQMQGHKGFDLNVELGPDFNLQEGGGTSFAAKLEVGKKFNKNFLFGVGAGLNAGGGSTSWPIYGALRTFLPSETSKIIPTVALRGGYVFNADCPFVAVAPGVVFPISKSVDLTAALEYTASFMDGATGNTLGVHVGLGLHKSNNSVSKPWAETREQGLQYVVESEGTTKEDEFSVGGKILAMYKLNPQISFGAGIGYTEGSTLFYKDKEYDEEYWLGVDNYFTFLLRGKYTFTQTKVAPFVSLDLGAHFVTPGEDDGLYNTPKTNKVMFYTTPSVGVSLQVAGNSWIDLKAGYEICPSTIKSSDKFSGSSSRFSFGVSFTHTTKIFSDGLF